MIKFPSIEQFKNVIHEVTSDTRYSGKDESGKAIYNNVQLPVLTFFGTTKTHGSNGGISYYKLSDKIIAQSRSRQLSLDHDNLGFCAYVLKHEDYWKNLCKNIVKEYDSVTLFGEWAGPGIQSGVAVSLIPNKIFIIFSILFKKGDENYWVDTCGLKEYLPDDINIVNAYNVEQFGLWEISIDFNSPALIQNTLIDITDSIEKECPVGKYFGISSIGEGIVFSFNLEHKVYRFKVKGEKHSNSKVKTLAPIDEEAYNNAREFAKNYVTQSRLEQGIFYLKNELDLDIEIKNLGAFIKWVTDDVFKEESKNIAENDLDAKKVAKEIGNIARIWFMKNHT